MKITIEITSTGKVEPLGVDHIFQDDGGTLVLYDGNRMVRGLQFLPRDHVTLSSQPDEGRIVDEPSNDQNPRAEN